MCADMKMIRKCLQLVAVGCSILLCTACWREDLSNCWLGNVNLDFFAEKWTGQVDAQLLTGDVYLNLYDMKDSSVVISTVYDGINQETLKTQFEKLPFGTYRAIVVANQNVLTGQTPWNDVWVERPDAEQDVLIRDYVFTLDCDCGYSDIVELYRANGAVTVNLLRLPENIVDVTVSMDNLYEKCSVDTVYAGNSVYSERKEFNVESDSKEMRMGFRVLPTVAGEMSCVHLLLTARNGDGSVFEGVNRDVASIELKRNEHINVEVDFNYNISVNPDITVTINPDWDGVIDDGETDFS